MNEKTRRVVGLSIVSVFWVLVPLARAESSDPIKLEMVVRKEITVTDPNGAKKVELVDPKLVVPGDEVIYRINYTNVGKEPTTSVVVTNRIPEHMTYVRDSAGGDHTNVLFSVDGTAFAPRDRLQVKTPEGKLRPAHDEELTHVRWIVNADVPPGQGGTVAYHARLQ
jgi:uncharacterized repeat protein (TIGR01451 family)